VTKTEEKKSYYCSLFSESEGLLPISMVIVDSFFFRFRVLVVEL